MDNNDTVSHKQVAGMVAIGVVGVALVVGLLFGLWFALAGAGRYQRLQDEQNQVQINDIKIAQTHQLVEVENQKAAIRVADANGIAKAQEIIAGSLTPNYLTYLAIQAQQEMATHDHTATIYIPTGPNGIPIVGTQPAVGK